MFNFGNLLAVVFIIYGFLHTVSFGVWTWRQNNRGGAVGVMLIALASVLVPAYLFWTRL